jgi:excisionase family DNA binding protein
MAAGLHRDAADPRAVDGPRGVFALNEVSFEAGRTPDHQAAVEPVHTLEDVAVMPGVSTRTVRRHVRAGHIRKLPLAGRLVRIPSSEVERLLST